MKKTVFTIALLILVSLLLTGCLSLSTELSERWIVGALGIDYIAEQYEVTVLCFNTDLAENANATFDVAYISGKGKDLHEAFLAARLSTAKKLFFGHNTVLVLGRTLAEHRIYDTAVYLSQNNETRLNITVFMSDGTAEEIIKLRTSDKAHISGSLEKLAESKPNGLDVKVQLFQLMQSMPGSGVEGFLPVLDTVELPGGETEDGEKAEKLHDMSINKIAVFHGSALLGEAADDIMTGIFLIQNRVETLDMTILADSDTQCYGVLLRARTQITVTGRDEFVAEITLNGSVSVRGKSDFISDAGLNELKTKFEAEAERYVMEAYVYMKDRLKIDFFDTQWYAAANTTLQAAGRYYAAGNIPKAAVTCSFGIIG